MRLFVLFLFSAAPCLHSPAYAEDSVAAVLTYAPNVPPKITRSKPAVVKVRIETAEVEGVLMEGLSEPTKYIFWTFNGRVPGPFIRARQGDTLELTIASSKDNTMPHNIDIHAVLDAGGGAEATLVQPGESKKVRFALPNAGLFVYHCAAPPMPDHIANGMYGLIYVEPTDDASMTDKEFYVMQGEFYTKEEIGTVGVASFDRKRAEAEDPTYFVFNGQVGALQEKGTLQVKVNERVRIYFGNIGPAKPSAFHIAGTGMKTEMIAPGETRILDLSFKTPGEYPIMDHVVFRMEKGAVGAINASK